MMPRLPGPSRAVLSAQSSGRCAPQSKRCSIRSNATCTSSSMRSVSAQIPLPTRAQPCASARPARPARSRREQPHRALACACAGIAELRLAVTAESVRASILSQQKLKIRECDLIVESDSELKVLAGRCSRQDSALFELHRLRLSLTGVIVCGIKARSPCAPSSLRPILLAPHRCTSASAARSI